MKVWIFNQYAATPYISGGTRHYELARQLVKLGHEVTIFASSFLYNTYKETQKYPSNTNHIIEWIDGVRFVWIKTLKYKNNNWKRYFNILDYARKIFALPLKVLIEKPDIIVGSSFSLFTPLAAHRLAKKIKVPFILEIRDLWPETLIQLGKSKWHPLVLFLGFVERYLYRKAAHIVLLFPKAHEYILNLNLGISKEKMTWIPNGADCSIFENVSENDRKDKRLDFLNNGKFNILNAGSLGNVYNLDKFVLAASILQEKDKDIHFSLVGNGPLEDQLKNQVKELGLKNLSFHPILPKNLVPALLNKSDILYASLMDSPLYKYGMSLNKIHEYLASGKPIVFGVNAINNPVDDAKAGITVSSDNPEEIAAAILKIKNLEPLERNALGDNGNKHAKEEYDFEILGRRFEALLKTKYAEFKGTSKKVREISLPLN